MSYRILQETAVRYFLEVVRTGSVKDAAVKLNVAPSAVSRQVARLEGELNTLLFDRRARGLVPNAAGELLAAYAKRTQQDIERVTGEIQALRGLRAGRVRVASVAGLAHEFLPSLAAGFRGAHEGIRFDLDVCPQGDIARRIRDGEADIGVTLAGLPEPNIEVELRHPAPVLAIMAPDHPLAGQRQISLSQVTAYPLALAPADSSLRQLLDTSCSRQGLRYQTVFSSNYLDSLVSFAAAGAGVITFYGELSVRSRLLAGTIAAIPLRDREMNERYIEIQTLAKRNLPEAARAFVEQLTHAITSVSRRA
ncbi:DNA-binding transcriptional regulator, LysR family [Cupriavidus sp. YR651]|uniref:LysR substrate-binding domain-containing protein n=1 Tax=Cupriavidus sp. YR651 TaxID=1855315 RepID=UPI00087FC0F7|nr:LysR substrate-binding domain-containing protein [Cupriavidus sp. YR651]SDC70518.1 DNA-binding transcriptional regulator, LysR family [Cupriavidus sp. YR651]